MGDVVGSLTTFRAALAARNSAPCDILGIGDSIGEGVGPTTRYNRWWDLFRDSLRNKFPQTATGGYGYIPAGYGNAGITAFWTFTGGSRAAAASATYGLGRRTNAMTTTGDKMVGQVLCTGFDIFFAGDTTSGVGYYKVDGGSATTFDTAQASATGGHRVQVRGLTAGSHSIEIGWSSGGTVTIEGIMVYNGDESSGVRVWDGFRSSQASPYWVSPNTAWQATIASVNPSLVILEFAVNDATLSTGVSTMISNLQALIASIRLVSSPSIVVAATWPRGASTEGTYAPYYSGLAQLVAADTTLSLFDMVIRTYTNEDAAAVDMYGYLDASLHLHPTDKGSRVWADALLDFVSPAPGSLSASPVSAHSLSSVAVSRGTLTASSVSRTQL